MTLVVAVIEVAARMFPTNSVPVPSVADVPTCQKTLHSCAPLVSVTMLFDAVTSVDAVLKMKTELGSLFPSSINEPVRLSAPLPAAPYTPAGNAPAMVPRSLGSITSTGRLERVLQYATPRSTCACCAGASFAGPTVAGRMTTPGGNPVMEGPGERPTLPSRMLRPVFVTVEAPSTE